MSARASIIPVFIPHWGCPHACVFCNQRRISGVKHPADAETVRAEVERARTVLPKGERAELAFYGGSFTAIPAEQQEALLSAAKAYLDEGVLSSIRLSTRPDAIDADVLSRLHRYGVETIELGAQSLCDEVLQCAHRGHTAADVENASRLIRASGFRLILLKPDGVRIYPTVIVQDTELYDRWRAGEYREHTVEDAVALCARLLPLFEKAGIPVIRLGLNPTEELSGGAAVAGAYHPALGELVRSRILRNRAEVLLTGTVPGSKVTLFVHPKKHSQMAGQHRCNITTLQEEFSLAALRILPDASLAEDEIRIET